jgi:hypothetical protein
MAFVTGTGSEDVAMEALCWFCSQPARPGQAMTTPSSLGIPVHRDCFRADTGQDPVDSGRLGADPDTEDTTGF